jgi:hypothetical protein
MKNNKKNRTDVICLCCGDTIVTAESPDYKEKRRNKTCSKKCFAKVTSKRMKAKHAKSMLDAGAVLKNDGSYVSLKPCETCGGEITVVRAREAKNKSFCSVKCKAQWQAGLPYDEWRGKIGAKNKGKLSGEKHPMWGTTPPHGKWTRYKASDGKEYKFRSKWEANVALYFDIVGEPWEYESKRFTFSDCTYTPDFYLPKRNQYIEVKGWMSERSKRQVNAFRRESDATLVVWGYNMYNGVLKNIGFAS